MSCRRTACLLLAAASVLVCAGAHADERRFLERPPTVEEFLAFLDAGGRASEGGTRGIRIKTPSGEVVEAAPDAPARIEAGYTTIPAAPEAQPAAAPDVGPNILAAPVNFALDSAEIPASFLPYLDSLAAALGRPESRGVRVLITGHTDSQGSADYNLALSMRRAASVERFLLGRGVRADQILCTGRGEAEPVEGLASDHSFNRRVEFQTL